MLGCVAPASLTSTAQSLSSGTPQVTRDRWKQQLLPPTQDLLAQVTEVPAVQNIYEANSKKPISKVTGTCFSLDAEQGEKTGGFFNTIYSSKPSCLSPKQTCPKQATGWFASLQVCSTENVLIKTTQSCWRMESRDEKAEHRVQENACT